MKEIAKFYINIKLTRGGLVSNTLYIKNNKIKDYEIASFNTSDFS